MFGGAFGDAGRVVVVEEFLEGEEASFIVMAAGEQVLPLATSQDHKRLRDGDEGPNTGGMGAYSPAPVVTPALHARIMREVIAPTLRRPAAEGMPYTGFLYAGLMIAKDGTPNVLEFNCRFGDPETQPVLSRLASDLVRSARRRSRAVSMKRAPIGTRAPRLASCSPRPAIRKSRARRCDRGARRCGAAPGKVFHAATRESGGRIVTSGGRVLCAVGLGDGVAERASSRLRTGRPHPLEWHAVPPRYRLAGAVSRIYLRREHELTPRRRAEGRARRRSACEAIRRFLRVAGRRALDSHPSVNGKVVVGEDDVVVEAKLGFLLAMFRDRIDEELVRILDKEFPEPKKA
jgi:hypothetical protein